ncbi:MAG: LysR family transcriptional regulator [Rhizomicrobium sp.]
MGDGRWDDFRYFLAVAKTASIKRAAADLRTTQSAVSKRLNKLERSLGVRLLDRRSSGTTLTYQGQRILSHALSAETALARAKDGAKEIEGRVTGDCSIQLSDGIANFWIAQFLPGFFDLHPQIELKLMLDQDAGMTHKELFDIRLHYRPPSDGGQVTRPLCTVHFIPFASRGYVEKHGAPRTIPDLANHRLIDQLQYLISKGSWAAWFENAPLKHTSLFTNQSSFLARSVESGAGVGLMPTYIVLAARDLVPLDIGMRLPLRLYASYHREQALKAPVRTTLTFLRERIFDLKRMPWFGQDFAAPEPAWTALHQQALARAANVPLEEDQLAAE